eukprot:1182448-Prorocentrum_minimum.AAC.26
MPLFSAVMPSSSVSAVSLPPPGTRCGACRLPSRDPRPRHRPQRRTKCPRRRCAQSLTGAARNCAPHEVPRFRRSQ